MLGAGLAFARTGGHQGKTKKPSEFIGKEIRITNFYLFRFERADGTAAHPYSKLVLQGTPRLLAEMTSFNAKITGTSANLDIDEGVGRLHHGKIIGNVVATVTSPDPTDGEHVTVLTSPTVTYDDAGSNEKKAFTLNLTAQVQLSSVNAKLHEKAYINGGSGKFKFSDVTWSKDTELVSGTLEGPVKLRFEGVTSKDPKAQRTVVTGHGDRMEISRDGPDYLVKLIGNVVFDDNKGLHFEGDLDKSASFRFSSDFGFKGFDGGYGKLNVPKELIEESLGDTSRGGKSR